MSKTTSMKDHYYDKLLNIKTGGYQRSHNDTRHYHRYEPTPYAALEILFEDYKLTSNDHVVDFGSGKGRLNFYTHYFFRSAVTGVEMNKLFYQEALTNRTRYFEKNKANGKDIDFKCCFAEDYKISPLDNKFYFFNPFSVQIFIKIINNILDSVETSKRDIELILYYGSEDYLFHLENNTTFEMIEEIQLPILYDGDPYEKFTIWGLTPSAVMR